MLFKTNRFKIIKAVDEDFNDYLEMVQQPELFKFGALMTQEVQDKSKAKETFDIILMDKKTSTFVVKNNKRVVGILTILYSEYLTTYEIGYVVNYKDWHNGIATEVTNAALKYLFQDKNASYVFATTVSNNLASRKVLEKCNFKLEGTLRNNCKLHNTLMDDVRYGITLKEWLKLHI